jgi:hypothetical protein
MLDIINEWIINLFKLIINSIGTFIFGSAWWKWDTYLRIFQAEANCMLDKDTVLRSENIGFRVNKDDYYSNGNQYDYITYYKVDCLNRKITRIDRCTLYWQKASKYLLFNIIELFFTMFITTVLCYFLYLISINGINEQNKQLILWIGITGVYKFFENLVCFRSNYDYKVFIFNENTLLTSNEGKHYLKPEEEELFNSWNKESISISELLESENFKLRKKRIGLPCQ